MRMAIGIVVALVIGFVLGGFGPRADLRDAQAQLTEARKHAQSVGPKSTDLRGVKDLLRLPDDNAVRERAAVKRATHAAGIATSETAIVASAGLNHTGAVAQTATGALRRAQMTEELRKASDLWNTRAAMARNSFVGNVELNAGQAEAFDTLVAAMNLRLETGINQWVETIRKQGALTTEDSIRAMNTLSSALTTTYDEMDRLMPPGWRGKTGEDFELVNFVDPAVAMPLVEFEGVFDGGGGTPGGNKSKARHAFSFGLDANDGPSSYGPAPTAPPRGANVSATH